MLISEMIENLQQTQRQYGDLEVQFAYNYRDHWNTQVAAPVGDAQVGEVAYSEYHRMDKVVDEQKHYDDDDFDEEYGECENIRKVLLLSS